MSDQIIKQICDELADDADRRLISALYGDCTSAAAPARDLNLGTVQAALEILKAMPRTLCKVSVHNKEMMDGMLRRLNAIPAGPGVTVGIGFSIRIEVDALVRPYIVRFTYSDESTEDVWLTDGPSPMLAPLSWEGSGS